MIREDQATAENQKLLPYNDFLRALATEKKCLLADLNADMQCPKSAFWCPSPSCFERSTSSVPEAETASESPAPPVRNDLVMGLL